MPTGFPASRQSGGLLDQRLDLGVGDIADMPHGGGRSPGPTNRASTPGTAAIPEPLDGLRRLELDDNATSPFARFK